MTRRMSDLGVVETNSRRLEDRIQVRWLTIDGCWYGSSGSSLPPLFADVVVSGTREGRNGEEHG